MEERFKLFDAVLEALHTSGALASLILIGSWCLHVYRCTYPDSDEIPSLITSDIDFLVPQTQKFTKTIDVSNILKDLGFEIIVSPINGYTKYIRRELEIEFLVPEIGRGKDGPRVIKNLNIDAQALRYLDMLREYTEWIPYRDIPLRVVGIEAYIVHKFLVSGRRKDRNKREKDITSAVQLLEYISKLEARTNKLKYILESLHPRWKRDVIDRIRDNSPSLASLLNLQ